MVEAPLEPTFDSRQDEARNELIYTYNNQQDQLQKEVSNIKEEFEEVRDILKSIHYIDDFLKEKIIDGYQNAIDFRLGCYEELEIKIEALEELK